MRVCTRFPRRSLGDKSCTYHAQSVARTSFARGVRASYPGPRGREYSYHAEPWRACTYVRACVCARFLPRSLETTVVRVMRKAYNIYAYRPLRFARGSLNRFPRSYTFPYIPPLHGITYIYTMLTMIPTI